MNEKRLEQLAQEELDGVSTPERSRELEALLSGSEEARRQYEEIRSVFRILAQPKPIEPPTALKSNVLRAVEQRRPAPAPGGWGARIATALRFERPLRMLTAFAVGALVASVLTVAAMRVAREGDGSFVSGTMGGGAAAIVDQRTLELRDGSVEFTARRAGERVTVRVVVRSKAPLRVALEGDAHTRWVAVRPIEGNLRFDAASGTGSLGMRCTGDAVAEVELVAPRDAASLQIQALNDQRPDDAVQASALKLQ